MLILKTHSPSSMSSSRAVLLQRRKYCRSLSCTPNRLRKGTIATVRMAPAALSAATQVVHVPPWSTGATAVETEGHVGLEKRQERRLLFLHGVSQRPLPELIFLLERVGRQKPKNMQAGTTGPPRTTTLSKHASSPREPRARARLTAPTRAHATEHARSRCTTSCAFRSLRSWLT